MAEEIDIHRAKDIEEITGNDIQVKENEEIDIQGSEKIMVPRPEIIEDMPGTKMKGANPWR